jgi:hypothetical protein
MKVELELHGSASDALREDMSRWLMDEPELRGKVSERRPPMSETELGGVADVLIVALASGGAASVLAASLREWFAQPRRSDVSVRIRWPDG